MAIAEEPPSTWIAAPVMKSDGREQMPIYKEKIFGPVPSVVRSPDFETATKLVNEHEYGNGVAIFTPRRRCRPRVHEPRPGRHRRRQRADPGANGVPPLWRLEALALWRGPEGVRLYTRLETVTARWPADIRAGTEY
jgi:malonate-semialdehyde dehydrogenase (acetylating)/methylmalonate-semialdehyde dehydrogenase